MSTELNEIELNLLHEIAYSDSCDSLKHILHGYTLADFQTKAIAWCIIWKRMIISLDTGLGKTLIASSIMNLIPEPGKWIFMCQLNSLRQTYEKISKCLPNKVILATDSSKSAITYIMSTDIRKVDIYLVTYESFKDIDFNTWILRNKEEFIGIFLDESHNVANNTSRIHDYLKLMLEHSFKYQYFLTATPLRVSPIQFINQVSVMDPKLVRNPERLAMMCQVYENGVIVGYKNLEAIAKLLSPRYLNISREEIGCKGNYEPIFVPILNDTKIPGKDTPNNPKIQKSDPNGLPIQSLVQLVLSLVRKGKKGIIYANLNKYKSLIVKELSQFCSVGEISGRINVQERKILQDKFNNNELQVLVINVTESLDLTCDFIIFYELTSLYKQVIGRGERGLSGRDLQIYFMVITDNYDMNFFFKHVYQCGILLESLCHKNISELHGIHDQIKEYLSGTQKLLLEDILAMYEEEL